ncbi:MAG: HAD family phosphatase [Pseudomonadota bacterium]
MQAILWDMDGTLIDSEPLHELALMQALEKLGHTAAPDLHDHVLGMSAEAVYGWLCREVGLDMPFKQWITMKYELYMAGVETLKPVPGALETWAAADAADVRQAVASNSDRIVVNANLGRFDMITPGMVSVCRNDIRKGKPDPEIYLRAAWLLGVDPADAVVVEDSGTGAAAGLAAGMQVYLVPTSEVAVPEGATKLQDFAELRALFES